MTRGVLCENSDTSYKDKDKDKVAALKTTLMSWKSSRVMKFSLS